MYGSKIYCYFYILGCEILGKAEFCNGGGSVKDRAALYLIKQAEDKGIVINVVTIM